MTTLRLLLKVAIVEDLEILQLDVKTIFLHGDMGEKIYMEQPKGFVPHSEEHLVCQCKKCL